MDSVSVSVYQNNKRYLKYVVISVIFDMLCAVLLFIGLKNKYLVITISSVVCLIVLAAVKFFFVKKANHPKQLISITNSGIYFQLNKLPPYLNWENIDEININSNAIIIYTSGGDIADVFTINVNEIDISPDKLHSLMNIKLNETKQNKRSDANKNHK